MANQRIYTVKAFQIEYMNTIFSTALCIEYKGGNKSPRPNSLEASEFTNTQTFCACMLVAQYQEWLNITMPQNMGISVQSRLASRK